MSQHCPVLFPFLEQPLETTTHNASSLVFYGLDFGFYLLILAIAHYYQTGVENLLN